jgi:hypothetical protein
MQVYRCAVEAESCTVCCRVPTGQVGDPQPPAMDELIRHPSALHPWTLNSFLRLSLSYTCIHEHTSHQQLSKAYTYIPISSHYAAIACFFCLASSNGRVLCAMVFISRLRKLDPLGNRGILASNSSSHPSSTYQTRKTRTTSSAVQTCFCSNP